VDPASESLLAALRGVKYPGYSRDIVSFGLVRSAAAQDGVATVFLEVTTADPQVPAQLHAAAVAALRGVPGVREARVEVGVKLPKNAPPPAATVWRWPAARAAWAKARSRSTWPARSRGCSAGAAARARSG
jgi:metal-sulfur cluster biosynthetic enzyme